MKKAAVMLYPLFSMQEISCTPELFKFYGKEQFRGGGSLIIAAISSAPLLLGKAGLLEGRRFTHGVFEEFLDAFPVMPRAGMVRTYLVEDGNLITAYSGAFREFAAAVGRRVGLDCPDAIFSDMSGKTWTEEEFIFHLPPVILEEARAFWDSCLETAKNK